MSPFNLLFGPLLPITVSLAFFVMAEPQVHFHRSCITWNIRSL